MKNDEYETFLNLAANERDENVKDISAAVVVVILSAVIGGLSFTAFGVAVAGFVGYFAVPALVGLSIAAYRFTIWALDQLDTERAI